MIELIELINEVEKILNSKADWEMKYHVIFNMNVTAKIEELNLPFDWYSDSSYEEDVCVYVRALFELRDRINKLFEEENNDSI